MATGVESKSEPAMKCYKKKSVTTARYVCMHACTHVCMCVCSVCICVCVVRVCAECVCV